jgi:hypothetical protein
VKFASCRPSGASNFEIALRDLENLCRTLLDLLLLCALYNEAVIIPNSRTVNEYRIGKDVNRTCRGLIGSIIPAFIWTN